MNGYESAAEAYRDYRKAICELLDSYLHITEGDFSPFLRAKEELEERLAVIRQREAAGSGYIPIAYIGQCFGISDAMKAAVMCVYFGAVDSEVGYLCAQVSQKGRFLEANDIIGLFFPSPAEFLMEREAVLYLFQMDARDMAQYSMPLMLQNRIFALLCGEENAYRYPYFARYAPDGLNCAGMVGNQEEKAKLCTLIGTYHGNVAITGADGSGRKRLLLTACEDLGIGLIFVDWMLLGQEEDIRRTAQDVKRELFLQRACCCIVNLRGETDREALGKLCIFAGEVASVCGTVYFIATENETKTLSGVMELKTMKIAEPSYAERRRLWELYLPEAGDACGELANLYRLTPGRVKELSDACREELAEGKPRQVTAEMVKQKCIASFSDTMGNMAHPIKSGFTFDDLILPESEKRQIKEGLSHVRYGHAVYDVWNFKEKHPYGRGLAMLFEGAPGTGKTMAASVISTELGMPAFQIDLSRVISKYIGETEKRLGEVFDIARRSHVILFFDETDALFGKRSEIKDSHDRYANIETAYLLQQIEEFDGITLMATNFMKNIDDAFLRRIQYIIHFPYPDCTQREALWRSSFPAQADVDAGVDYGLLAGRFELSGAMIKNTALSAAFLAVADNAPISMKHIAQALKTQMKKHGRTVTKEELEDFYGG